MTVLGWVCEIYRPFRANYFWGPVPGVSPRAEGSRPFGAICLRVHWVAPPQALVGGTSPLCMPRPCKSVRFACNDDKVSQTSKIRLVSRLATIWKSTIVDDRQDYMMKTSIAKTLLGLLIRLVGMRVRDVRTGKDLGKYLFIPWRGRILVFGLGIANDEPFYPVFLPQTRLTYALQELGFRQHPEPDFPNERDSHSIAYASAGKACPEDG
jgi:hypothetical protein